MNAESGEKSFEATPQRIARAKREGDVARAQEFGANAAFLAALLGTLACVPLLGANARLALAAAARGEVPLGVCAAMLAWALVPMACAAGAGAIGNVAQNGGLRFVAIAPKFERLSPVGGIKRMLSRSTLAHALRAFAAFAIAGGASIFVLRDVLGGALARTEPRAFAAIGWSGAVRVTVSAAAIGAAFALAEYGFARREWLRKLRMSYDELRREIKERDGDPLLRGRRRAMQRAFARGSIRRVNEAAFVLVNPTHVAVALAYAPPAIPVPTVLVRAADEAALRVRELAAAHRIPIVENVPLARALYRDGEVDRPIPHAHYVAIAEIVAALARAGVLEDAR
ncbi:MAG: EscU/YscU/HrcU family type III secretion system export apparatus switch protein [bacterium]|nr:EscU/YscU/HrcU family type III secretion system export apparatus switch protein [bacterium]